MTVRRLVLAGWTLLALAWIFGNPPFAGPDEQSHYLRALDAGRGDLITTPRPELTAAGTAKQIAWQRQITYETTVPAGLQPHNYECWTSDPETDAGCIVGHVPVDRELTTANPVGNYQPLPYVLTGAAARTADAPGAADRLARIVNALLMLGLLYVALRLTWSPDAGPVSLLGLLVAVTPMAIFCGAMLNGSGPEIAAGIAFAAALLRLRRDESCARSPGVWAAIGLSGAVLALTRTTGPVYLVAIAVAVLALGGMGPAWRFVRGRAPVALAALAALVAAVGLNLAWERAHGSEGATGFADLRSVLDAAVAEWWRASSELIGKFGFLEYRLPAVAYVAWFAAGFVLVALALRVAGRRQRIAFAVTVAAALVMPMLLFIYAIRHTGFGLQGRHVLPLLVVVPLIAGELIRAHAGALSERLRRGLVTGVPAVVAAVHLLAFYWAARRAAVGTDGPLVFLGDAGWSPPLGWVVWLLVATAGAALLAVSPRLAATGRE